MSEETQNEGWHRLYDEEPLFSRDDVLKALRDFLEYAGYKETASKPVGFMKPDVTAWKVTEGKRSEMIFVVRDGINGAVEGFRQLAETGRMLPASRLSGGDSPGAGRGAGFAAGEQGCVGAGAAVSGEV